MIPVLAVPCLRRDLVGRMLASVDVPVGRTIVIDNGCGVDDVDAWVIRIPGNLGVAGSWNLAMKATPKAAWWAIVNDDIVFAPGDLERLAEMMDDPGPRIAVMDGFAAFGINRAALARAGYFDENFVPAYVEDCDMEWRARLVGVPIVRVEAGLLHNRSATISMPEYHRQNARTYPKNLDYFHRKWGGSPRGGEVYERPFNGTAAPSEWTLDPERLRDLGWETTMRKPEEAELR